jgi:hypothetical protein
MGSSLSRYTKKHYWGMTNAAIYEENDTISVNNALKNIEQRMKKFANNNDLKKTEKHQKKTILYFHHLNIDMIGFKDIISLKKTFFYLIYILHIFAWIIST